MRHYTPFSNGSEATSWMSLNCDNCKPKCPKKRNMDLSFGSGTINQNTADWIGYDKKNVYLDYITLNSECNHWCKYIPKKRKTKQSSNQKSLF